MAAEVGSRVQYVPVKYQAYPWQRGSPEVWISPKLKSIAEQLRQYSSPGSSADEDGGVTSSVGMPASVASLNDLNVFPTKKRAAVLVCLHQTPEGELRVILTKRTASMSSHSGEVCLPGGKRDEGDVDDTVTALREAQEEIGLEPSHVRVVAVLEQFLSKDLLGVTPVIGLLDDVSNFRAVVNPHEVESLFEAPLEMFLKESEKHWFEERVWLGVKYRVHFFDYTTHLGEKFLIWGLTASILIRSASLVYQREPDFVEFAPDFSAIVNSSKALGGKSVDSLGATPEKNSEE
ncbi:peroxisomal coenzyme A diphosphatase NUDT7 [Marchantia polymorpha subsp. ruderalis]|uniref:Nudix hydrolase domain-containing protein n=3 Tax=Marchantia polymorpha TaxID=3197 RepID=A0A176WB02_MARPO|nr:hypothetical protein AXG93_3102s1020 [Marchantia polymorpha subsp. ruderalis]PTQ40033.1 hypothetical protein MARPO_0042s0071 [Marchantia polymorpha]PTQ40034.1 hypothetical protein MARPO_0042s0071 [Marchantia polymorpha]BBN02335.1 hypothetical protein Mp_2g14440 [Marchantia polymorpha subsp. ruderalis]BBN02336.1 hypothetical protein Mp_2g14440 [Marchantia polymorpha subsp. ruderalis]|eukprot:PTQ40033.1 hypothetical protein MARPO_0042s0071 [Marchantia polymorpha]